MNRDQMPAGALDECRTCEAPIVWTTHERTLRAMPVDVEPSEGGTLALRLYGAIVSCRVVKPELAYGRTDLHLSHFANCPDAPKWRRR